MLIFNLVGAGFLTVGVLVAWAILAVGYYFGVISEGGEWVITVAASVTFLLDITTRQTDWLKTGRTNAIKFIHPSSGGHIFFIPCWLLGAYVVFSDLILH